MRQTLSHQYGFVLGIVLVYFLVFSLMGMGVLALSRYFRIEAQAGDHDLSNKYAVESVLNKALWRINSGPDTLANFQDGSVTSQYVDSTRILTVSTNRWNQSRQVDVELEPDHPFNHGLAYLIEPDDTTKGSITTLPGHGLRQFDFLPAIDTAYYKQNAVQIYTSDTSFKDTMPYGIHYVESGKVTLKKGAYLEGSLVVMETLSMKGNNITLRAITDSAGVYIPVLILADSADISSNPNVNIFGAVFCEGYFDVKGGDFTGPLVTASIKLKKNIVIDDTNDEKYYVWPPGFGGFFSYDWPKQIKKGTWRE